jgi:tRNAThr (cytosine32-N3)-methyltransferase
MSKEGAGPAMIVEVGAGAGNTAFPIMKLNQNPELELHACDFSKQSIEVIRMSPEYAMEDRVGRLEASVWDVASSPNEAGEMVLPEGVAPGSVDVVILVFIFSALAPTQWEQAVKNVWAMLKPGGIVLFRDYGRGDLAQVRFKNQRYLEENFYARGDGTRVYFFEEEELKHLWTGEHSSDTTTEKPEENQSNEESNAASSDKESPPPRFEVLNFGVDRRMLVNRQRRLKMYRCWLQARFKKP